MFVSIALRFSVEIVVKKARPKLSPWYVWPIFANRRLDNAKYVPSFMAAAASTVPFRPRNPPGNIGAGRLPVCLMNRDMARRRVRTLASHSTARTATVVIESLDAMAIQIAI
jgi:hypothetical protein